MTVLDRIKELAKKHDKTVKEVATDLEMGENSLYRFEKTIPNGQTLLKLAKYFNTSVDYLLELSESPESHDDLGILLGGVIFSEEEIWQIVDKLNETGTTLKEYASWVKAQSEYQSEMWKDIKQKPYLEKLDDIPVNILWKLNELDNFYRKTFTLNENEILYLLNSSYYVLKSKIKGKSSDQKEKQLIAYSNKLSSLLPEKELNAFWDELNKEMDEIE
ncbi:helix-turn-helix domain-containing protein [Lactococcus lactis]|uniref:Helix-turn-helix transcriptional regulator n=1 Tax=Lactococcus lactis TaxID=1358 RepID=A0AAW8UEX4_9LACT|nr:helix-turn-helix transcriptional regulator [Lactococcus lactis]MDT2879895.1 helix-turn-helix transcriptional regulator [Lactococcus lactis]MDT2886305.1 helix-turn-helix transcriptional regulator [Lactococcus lactis]MDT2928643.1 helix-turn-helix transcriptional regulator [Lactococcus lactis]MDT2944644.1 helix-turn-helix transcriptional regulator [Lactococcus lactis]